MRHTSEIGHFTGNGDRYPATSTRPETELFGKTKAAVETRMLAGEKI